MKNSFFFVTSFPASESRIPEATLGIRKGPTVAIRDSKLMEYVKVATPVTRNGKVKLAKAITIMPALRGRALFSLRIAAFASR